MALRAEAGYSALAAGSWLKPHFGRTNAQLKWHVGQPGCHSASVACAYVGFLVQASDERQFA